jgi:uncharacterized protein Yka (UPF0111/DUF47 family)
MPEVQNVGAADYAQYQPSQYPQEAYADDYNTQPEVYDENMAAMQSANKSRLGATILTAAVIAGLSAWGGHALGKRSAKDAIAKYEELQKKVTTLEKDADKVINNWFGNVFHGRNFAKKFKEAFKDFFKTVNEKIDNVKKTVKDKAKKAKKTDGDKK